MAAPEPPAPDTPGRPSQARGAGRPGVLLDRDGVLIEDLGYIGAPECLRPIPGAAKAIAALHDAGVTVAVVTNQSGVARGLFGEDDVCVTNDALSELMACDGDAPDAYYFCPHHPEGQVSAYAIECDCRKPKPGLAERAIDELGLDRARTVMVGDESRDIECGRAAGLATVVVGPHAEMLDADHRARCLADAVPWILARVGARRVQKATRGDHGPDNGLPTTG